MICFNKIEKSTFSIGMTGSRKPRRHMSGNIKGNITHKAVLENEGPDRSGRGALFYAIKRRVIHRDEMKLPAEHVGSPDRPA